MVPKHIMKSLIPKGDIVNTVSKGHFPTAETFSLTKLKKKKLESYDKCIYQSLFQKTLAGINSLEISHIKHYFSIFLILKFSC